MRHVLQHREKLYLLVARIHNDEVARSSHLSVLPRYGVLVQNFLQCHAVISLSTVAVLVSFGGSIFCSQLAAKCAQPVMT